MLLEILQGNYNPGIVQKLRSTLMDLEAGNSNIDANGYVTKLGRGVAHVPPNPRFRAALEFYDVIIDDWKTNNRDTRKVICALVGLILEVNSALESAYDIRIGVSAADPAGGADIKIAQTIYDFTKPTGKVRPYQLVTRTFTGAGRLEIHRTIGVSYLIDLLPTYMVVVNDVERHAFNTYIEIPDAATRPSPFVSGKQNVSVYLEPLIHAVALLLAVLSR